MAKKR